ncbi:hypothetical protein [Ktedonospora formicarum]|uniref:Uncharacterized protein n=1 Tax=Ktedonospora formicarum TaxID=2778364 RepID=A0A8J3ICQ8_9CHLR|nr:hypothetical protein [Ktedonospora formicarum]GHO49878.1 hypothetical protein KSX_80410 [Ktedonospora formicarum]
MRRLYIQLATGLYGGVILWQLTSPAVYIDNCGSLQDCYHTIAAAVKAAIGLGILISVLLSLGAIAGWTPNKQPPKTNEGWWSKAGRFLWGVGEGLLPFGLVAGATALVSVISPVAAAVGAGALFASVIGYTYSHAPGPGVGDKVRSAFNAINPVSQVGEGIIGAQEAFNEGDYQEAGKQAANTALGVFGVFTLVSSLVRRAASALGLGKGTTVEPPAPATPEEPSSSLPEKELPLPTEGLKEIKSLSQDHCSGDLRQMAKKLSLILAVQELHMSLQLLSM